MRVRADRGFALYNHTILNITTKPHLWFNITELLSDNGGSRVAFATENQSKSRVFSQKVYKHQQTQGISYSNK